MQRYFVKEKINNKFYLNNNDNYHSLVVMRNKIGTNMEIVSNNKTYLCKISAIENNQVELVIIKELNENKTLFKIDIAQALVTEQKMSSIIQKSTELGAQMIIPLATKKCKVKLSESIAIKKSTRWNKIAIDASKQSKRQQILQVANVSTLSDLTNLEYDYKLICSTSKNIENIKNVLSNINECAKLLLVVGPESGLAKEEEVFLIENGFIPISLGDLVLRTETVALVLLSMLNYQFMR